MNKKFRYLLILGYPLLAVNVIVSLLYAVLWCRARSWQAREGVLTFVAGTKAGAHSRMLFDPAAQGWSPVVGFASEAIREQAEVRAHEFTHVWQEMMCGLLVLPFAAMFLRLGCPTAALITALSGGALFWAIYGASFLQHYNRRTGWLPAYEQIIFERQAYHVQERYLNDMSPGERAETWGHE